MFASVGMCAGDARLYFMYDLSGRSFSSSVDISPVIPLDYVFFCSRVFGGDYDFEAWNMYHRVVTPGVDPLTDGWLPVFLAATLMMLAYSYSFPGEFSFFLDEGFYLLVLSEVIRACGRCGVDCEELCVDYLVSFSDLVNRVTSVLR